MRLEEARASPELEDWRLREAELSLCFLNDSLQQRNEKLN
jgi:hypothetical protein